MNMEAEIPEPGDLLIVDDTPANLRLLYSMLTLQGYKVRMAPNGKLALMSAQAKPPALILLDIKMPGMSGYEVCEQLKANESTRNIPVLFLSALDQPEDKVKAFSAGGVDYITKPFHLEEVQARVDVHLSLQRAKKQLEIQNEQLKTQIAKNKELQAALRDQAIRDPLKHCLVVVVQAPDQARVYDIGDTRCLQQFAQPVEVRL